MISVVFLTYNRLGMVARCLSSMAYLLGRDDIEWLIWDNASEDGTADWLLKVARRYPNLKISLSAANEGVTGGRIHLFEQAKGDIIVSLDSDVEVLRRGWLDRLIAPLQDKSVGVVGHDGLTYTPSLWMEKQAGPDIDYVSGYCQAFRRDLLEKVSLDRQFNYVGWEDGDFCLQASQAGYQIKAVRDLTIRHNFGGTWDVNNAAQKGRKLFKEKWAGKGAMLFEKPTPIRLPILQEAV